MSDTGKPTISFEILTLFPEMFSSFLAGSLLGKAIDAGIVAVHLTNFRDFAPGKHRSVDDTPYGGGPGMILRPEPIADALSAVVAARGPAYGILLTPAGRLFDQRMALDLAARPRIALVCGRYEGFDQRIESTLVDETLSVGDYVLSGGEIPACVVIEAVSRLVPGVLGCAGSTVDESFSTADRLEHPQWTRPPEFHGQSVPGALLSGDHARIARWRRREGLRRTLARRPDLIARSPLSDEERALLSDED